jgi:hypothetical protein
MVKQTSQRSLNVDVVERGLIRKLDSIMPWYRCDARGETDSSAGLAFAATRFVEADIAETAVARVRKSLGRELVRHGVCPLNAEKLVSVETVRRIDEEDVPGIVAPDMVWMARA